MAQREEPASPEEAANQAHGTRWVAGVVARLEAETREQAERLRVAYEELDEARAARARAETGLHAVLAALRAGVPLPPDVLDDVTQLAAEAYEQSRADRAELVRELDETRTRLAAVEAELVRTLSPVVDGRTLGEWRSVGVTEPWTASAIRTRADVEARLAGGEHTRVEARFRAVKHVLWKGGSITTGEGGALLVDLVCAVLGVPNGNE